MRSLVAALAGLVAALALAVALPFAWLAVNIADEDGFVAATSQAAADREFRSAIIDVAADGVVERAGVPEALASTARSAVQAGATQIADSENFLGVFEQVQRASHRATFAAGDRVVLDLTPVSTSIVDSIDEGLPFELPAPDEVRTTISDVDAAPALELVESSTDRALLGLGVAAGAAALCLLAARRRSTALAGLGILSAASVWVVGRLVRDRAPDLLGAGDGLDPIGQRFSQLVLTQALDSFDRWVVVVLVGAAVAAALGLVGRLFSSR